jgi:hypothetical protein
MNLGQCAYCGEWRELTRDQPLVTLCVENQVAHAFKNSVPSSVTVRMTGIPRNARIHLLGRNY